VPQPDDKFPDPSQGGGGAPAAVALLEVSSQTQAATSTLGQSGLKSSHRLLNQLAMAHTDAARAKALARAAARFRHVKRMVSVCSERPMRIAAADDGRTCVLQRDSNWRGLLQVQVARCRQILVVLRTLLRLMNSVRLRKRPSCSRYTRGAAHLYAISFG